MFIFSRVTSALLHGFPLGRLLHTHRLRLCQHRPMCVMGHSHCHIFCDANFAESFFGVYIALCLSKLAQKYGTPYCSWRRRILLHLSLSLSLSIYIYIHILRSMLTPMLARIFLEAPSYHNKAGGFDNGFLPKLLYNRMWQLRWQIHHIPKDSTWNPHVPWGLANSIKIKIRQSGNVGLLEFFFYHIYKSFT